MPQTLEQKRAANAWQCAQEGLSHDLMDGYVPLVKGVPSLIMNSGLLQVLAFLHEKGSKDSNKQHQLIEKQLCRWLSAQFPQDLKQADFASIMNALMQADPQLFQDITREALAWLRWLRQIAPACEKLDGQTV